MRRTYANFWSQAAAGLTAISHTRASVFRWGVFALLAAVWIWAGLTAWGLHRFQTLRKLIELPDLPLTDPQYQQALTDGLTRVTATVLAETFLISAIVALGALVVTWWLRSDEGVIAPTGD